MSFLEDRLVTTAAEAGHEQIMVEIAINVDDDRRRRRGSRVVRRLRRRGLDGLVGRIRGVEPARQG